MHPLLEKPSLTSIPTPPKQRMLELRRKVYADYIAKQAAKYITELVTNRYSVYSWQLNNCFIRYYKQGSLPVAVLATVSAFCVEVDTAYPLTAQALMTALSGQKLTEFEYTSLIRREVEKKKAFILQKLAYINPII